MGTIINLYLFPKGPRASRPSAPEIGAALLEAGYVLTPMTIGPPAIRNGSGALNSLGPQCAAYGWREETGQANVR